MKLKLCCSFSRKALQENLAYAKLQTSGLA